MESLLRSKGSSTVLARRNLGVTLKSQLSNAAMDILNGPPTRLPLFDVLIVVLSIVFVFATFKYIVLDDDEETPVKFKVPVPEQCSPEWKGELLKEPAVKVASSPSTWLEVK